jgi:hypothetical protein
MNRASASSLFFITNSPHSIDADTVGKISGFPESLSLDGVIEHHYFTGNPAKNQ